MHELGIMTSVVETAKEAAQDAGATRLLKISLEIGDMTEAIEDALNFAFEVLCEADPYLEGCELEITMIHPRSICLECGEEFDHDRFHMFCPHCDSFATQLLRGREQKIASLEVDIPD